MRTVLCIPSLPRMSGGLAVLYQLAERLGELGREVAFVTPGSADAVPGLRNALNKDARLLPWPRPGLTADDLYIVPEGWLNALAPGLEGGAHCVVYVQNWAFLLSALPEGLDLKKLPLSFIAVSGPVAWFLESLLGLPVAGILRPALDLRLFAPGNKTRDHLRVAWMPRKNKAFGEEVRRIVDAALPRWENPPRLAWVPLHQMSHEQVAKELRRSHIFLVTGSPEGCPLPPLEAMAGGCLTIGSSGFGGWDYMRDAKPCGGEAWPAYLPTPDSFVPLTPGAWGNGFFQADGDVIGTSRAVLHGLRLWEEARGTGALGSELTAILDAARQTVQHYTPASQALAVDALWRQLENLRA